MSSLSTLETPAPDLSKNDKSKPKKPDSPKPAAPPVATEPAKRRKPRTMQANRAYYVAQVDAMNEVVGLILKLPTIGQARKARDNAAKCAKVPAALTRIIRVVMVD